MIRAVLFDFGGVIAEEGFREGLRAIALLVGLDSEALFELGRETVYRSRYVIGATPESAYWREIRERTGISLTDDLMRREIIRRFVLRPEMLAHADRLRSSGLRVAILSDQTNWLGEIDEHEHFSGHFDRVFNSYRLGKSKRDPSVFGDVCRGMGVEPRETLFVDDSAENVARARGAGLGAIRFTTFDGFEKELSAVLSSRIS